MPENNLVTINLAEPEPSTEVKNYIAAGEEIYRLKNELVSRHQRHLGITPSLPVKIVFRKKPKTPRKKRFLGSARLFSDADRLLHPFVFLITLDQEFWLKATVDQREALLLHELCHCGINEAGNYCLLPHDLEEFAYVVGHYGAWESDIQCFDLQLDLFKKNSQQLEIA